MMSILRGDSTIDEEPGNPPTAGERPQDMMTIIAIASITGVIGIFVGMWIWFAKIDKKQAKLQADIKKTYAEIQHMLDELLGKTGRQQ